MEEAYRDAVEQIKAVIAFLDKVKLDKKLRNEKEEIVRGLKKTVTDSGSILGSEDEDLYDEVEHTTNPGNKEEDAVYDDSAAPDQIQNDDVYIDNVEQDYDDCQTFQEEVIRDDVPCDELRDALICDFLQVKRERNILMGAWQKRWCVISQNVFYMYDSSKDKKQKEAFSLKGYCFEVREDISKEKAKKDRCFELKNSVTLKSYEFCASDKDAVTKWQRSIAENKNMKHSPSESHRPNVNYPDSPSTGDNNKGKGKIINIFGFANKKKKDAVPLTITPSDDLYIDNVVSPLPTEDTYDDNLVEQTYDDTGPADGGQQDEETYEELESEAKPKNARSSLALPAIPRTASIGSIGIPPPIPDTPKPLPKTPSRSSGKSNGLPPLPPPKDEFGSGSGTYKKNPPSTPAADLRNLPPPPGEGYPLPPPEMTGNSNAELLDEKNLENWFQGVWDCEANEDGELSFKRGDLMHVLSKEFDSHGWWAAKINNVVGLVPSSYLMEAYIT